MSSGELDLTPGDDDFITLAARTLHLNEGDPVAAAAFEIVAPLTMDIFDRLPLGFELAAGNRHRVSLDRRTLRRRTPKALSKGGNLVGQTLLRRPYGFVDLSGILLRDLPQRRRGKPFDFTRVNTRVLVSDKISLLQNPDWVVKANVIHPDEESLPPIGALISLRWAENLRGCGESATPVFLVDPNVEEIARRGLRGLLSPEDPVFPLLGKLRLPNSVWRPVWVYLNQKGTTTRSGGPHLGSRRLTVSVVKFR